MRFIFIYLKGKIHIMKLSNFYNNHYDYEEENDELYEEETQRAYQAKLRKNIKDQDKKHKKTSKPRRQDQKQESQELDYDNFLKQLKN